jgi:simple sugar transport system ATP-binding protein
VRQIKSRGKSCIFIDHNIFNVHQVVDRVVVVDRGKIAGEFNPREMTIVELVEHLQHVAETGVFEEAGAA